MMSGAIPITGYATSGAVTRRLSMSFAASVCVHAAAIAILLALLDSMPMRLSRMGSAPSIQVALVGRPSIRFSAPPEAPPLAADVPLAARPAEQQPPRSPAPSRLPTPSPMDQAQTQTPPGASIQSEASAADVPAGAVLPPGSTAVGTLMSTERLGHTQALRLAQRFPNTVVNPARLREPLIVPYPPRAAWNHREARIVALLILDANGHIVETSLFPDDPLFAPTVLDVLRRARFAPAELDGKSAPYWTLLEFVFTLRNDASPRPEARPG